MSSLSIQSLMWFPFKSFNYWNVSRVLCKDYIFKQPDSDSFSPNAWLTWYCPEIPNISPSFSVSCLPSPVSLFLPSLPFLSRTRWICLPTKWSYFVNMTMTRSGSWFVIRWVCKSLKNTWTPTTEVQGAEGIPEKLRGEKRVKEKWQRSDKEVTEKWQRSNREVTVGKTDWPPPEMC